MLNKSLYHLKVGDVICPLPQYYVVYHLDELLTLTEAFALKNPYVEDIKQYFIVVSMSFAEVYLLGNVFVYNYDDHKWNATLSCVYAKKILLEDCFEVLK